MPVEISDLDHRLEGPYTLAGGADLNYRDSVLIDNSEVSDGSNMIQFAGRLRTRPALGSFITLNPTATAGNAGRLFLHAFRREDGQPYLIVHNAKRIWTYDGSSVTDQGTLVSAPTYPALAGLDSDPWTSAVAHDADGRVNYFACDGQNEVVNWNGGLGAPAGVFQYARQMTGYVSPGYAPLKARYLLGFAGRLFLLYNDENGVVHAQRVRWSKNGDASKWDVSAGYGAGAADLAETPGEIVGGLVLGEAALIFKSDSIVGINETGNPRVPITFPQVLKIGCLSGGSLQAISPAEVLFLGKDNVYRFIGGAVTPIGHKIARKLFSFINYKNIRLICSAADLDNGLYYLFIPDVNTSVSAATRCFVYNWIEDSWSVPLDFRASEITSALRTNVDKTSTIDSYTEGGISPPINTCLIKDDPIDSFTSTSGPPALLVGIQHGSGDSRVFYFDPARTQDAVATPAAISSEATTKAFRFFPDGFSTLHGVHLYLSVKAVQSGRIQVYVSTDRGNSWSILSQRPLSAGDRQYLFFPANITARFHTLRFQTEDRVEIELVSATVSGRYPEAGF